MREDQVREKYKERDRDIEKEIDRYIDKKKVVLCFKSVSFVRLCRKIKYLVPTYVSATPCRFVKGLG